jgi:hypothetical protein
MRCLIVKNIFSSALLLSSSPSERIEQTGTDLGPIKIQLGGSRRGMDDRTGQALQPDTLLSSFSSGRISHSFADQKKHAAGDDRA